MAKGLCPACKQVIDSHASVCEHCGNKPEINQIPEDMRPPSNVLYTGCGAIVLFECLLDLSGVLLFLLAGMYLLGIILFICGLACGYWRATIFRRNALEYYYARAHTHTPPPAVTTPPPAPTTPAQPSTQDNLAAIATLKQLLDSGAITQEEYDQKKKQLLGL